MKKFTRVAFIGMLCGVIGFVGCKTTLSDKIKSGAKLIGKAAGYALNYSKIDAEVKDSIIVVLDDVAKVLPSEGQSYADAWSNAADVVLSKLIADGKIKEDQAAIIRGIVVIAGDGIEYMFDKHPDWKVGTDNVVLAASSFIDGMNSVIKKSCNGCVDLVAGVDYDKDAYEFFKNK